MDVRPQALNDRAAEVVLRMELRRAVADAEAAEAQAQQLDAHVAVDELRARLGRLVARRKRLHESELAAAKAAAETDIADARRRADEILSGHIVEPFDEASPAPEQIWSSPTLVWAEPAPETAAAAPPPAAHTDDLTRRRQLAMDRLIRPSNTIEAEGSETTPDSEPTGYGPRSSSTDGQAALASLATALSRPPMLPPPPPQAAPLPEAPRRLPLRAGSALPAPSAAGVVHAAPSASRTDAIAAALWAPPAFDEVKPVWEPDDVAEPTVAEPTVAEPIAAEPIVAEPIVAKPIVAEPIDAEPTVAQPAVEQPVAESVIDNAADLTITPLDIDSFALAPFTEEHEQQDQELDVESPRQSPTPQPAFDADVLAAALAKALAPLLEQRNSEPPPGYYRVVEPPAKSSTWSAAKHVDVALLSIALVIVLSIFASWML